MFLISRTKWFVFLTLMFALSPSFAQKSKAELDALSKTKLQTSSRKVLTKEYVVPGGPAISAAKRNGYGFQASNLNARPQDCKFMGAHWVALNGSTCKFSGFYKTASGAGNCRILADGWSLKQVNLTGIFNWEIQPRYHTYPFFRVEARPIDNRPSTVVLKSITLVGPEGPFKDWQKAFQRCM